MLLFFKFRIAIVPICV